MKFKDTIGIYDNIFSNQECQQLIDRFENAHKEGLSYSGKSGDGGINEYKKRVGRQFIFDTFLDKSANILNRFLTNRESRARRLIKSIYYKIK